MIPIDIARAIVSIPSALFNFTLTRKTDVAELNAEKALLEAQTNLATQQKALLDAQLALQQAREEADDAADSSP